MKFLYLILYITSFLFYILYKGSVSFYVFGFMTILPVVLFCINRFISAKTRIYFDKVPESVTKNAEFTLRIKIDNRSFFPVPNMKIKLSFSDNFSEKEQFMTINTPVYPRDEQGLDVKLKAEHCGKIRIEIRKCKVYDFLRLFGTTVRIPSKDNKSVLTITSLPELITLENPHFYNENTEGTEFSKIKKGNDSSEIFDVREFEKGDRISRIHWKLSARQDMTMVKEFSLPLENTAVVIDFSINEDAGNKALIYDTIISTVSALAYYFSQNGLKFRAFFLSDKNNGLSECQVESPDEYRTFMNILLNKKTDNKKQVALKSFAYNSHNIFYSHLFYISSIFDSDSIVMLENCKKAEKYSYFYVTENDENVKDFCDDNIDIVKILPDKIRISLSDIFL